MCYWCETVKLQSGPFDKVVNRIPFQRYMTKKKVERFTKEEKIPPFEPLCLMLGKWSDVTNHA
jgi:hypothetical protein